MPSRVQPYCSRKCHGLSRRKREVPKTDYKRVSLPKGHPLLPNGSHSVPEHRLLLWDLIGPGAHPCHYCGVKVEWRPNSRTATGSLTVDHQDRNPLNNAPENLVPSCQSCNSKNQAKAVLDNENYRLNSLGNRIRGERRNCGYCDKAFVVWVSKNRPRGGIYCSRKCFADIRRGKPKRRADWSA